MLESLGEYLWPALYRRSAGSLLVPSVLKSMKLEEFKQKISFKFLTVRIINHWTRVPWDAENSPSFGVFLNKDWMHFKKAAVVQPLVVFLVSVHVHSREEYFLHTRLCWVKFYLCMQEGRLDDQMAPLWL